nr:unnamed protein product [Callosobruchus chinensis]
MKSVTVLLAVVFLSAAVQGKVFQRCQLVKLLRDTYHMPNLATWVMDLQHGQHIHSARATFNGIFKAVSDLKNTEHFTLHQSIIRNNKQYKLIEFVYDGILFDLNTPMNYNRTCKNKNSINLKLLR